MRRLTEVLHESGSSGVASNARHGENGLRDVVCRSRFSVGLSRRLLFQSHGGRGGRLPLAAIWAISVSPALPILAAALAMDVWSGERQSGRLQALLTAPVRERDLVLGKFFGVWSVLEIALLTSLAASLTALWALAPQALLGVRLVGFCRAFSFCRCRVPCGVPLLRRRVRSPVTGPLRRLRHLR